MIISQNATKKRKINKNYIKESKKYHAIALLALKI